MKNFPKYILYKVPISAQNKGCQDTQNIVRYVHSLGFDIRPTLIFERNFPLQVTELPSISFENEQDKTIFIVGRENVLRWYNDLLKGKVSLSRINSIEILAEKWAQKNRRYRINDHFTRAH